MYDEDDDGDEGQSPFWHPLLLGEVCVGIGIVIFLRFAGCDPSEDACGSRRVAFLFLGLPLFSAGTFFVLTTVMPVRHSCLSVIGLWLFLALAAFLLTAAY